MAFNVEQPFVKAENRMKPSTDQSGETPVSRRQFLKNSSLATAGAVAATVSFPAVLRGQTKEAINAVIIGLGGRGAGAGEDFQKAIKATGVDGKIVAAADLFPEQARRATKLYDVPEDKCFGGFDCY